MKAYMPRPCRRCGAPKGNHRGWRCKACDEALFRERANQRSLCGDVSESHYPPRCEACRKIKRERQSEAAFRAVATRRRNNPGWAKPCDAERFWQGRAHNAVRLAIRRGLIPDLKSGEYACTDCDAVAVEYDHRDYGRPLDVQPVCRSCNKRRGTAKWPHPKQFVFPKIHERKSRAA